MNVLTSNLTRLGCIVIVEWMTQLPYDFSLWTFNTRKEPRPRGRRSTITVVGTGTGAAWAWWGRLTSSSSRVTDKLCNSREMIYNWRMLVNIHFIIIVKILTCVFMVMVPHVLCGRVVLVLDVCNNTNNTQMYHTHMCIPVVNNLE